MVNFIFDERNFRKIFPFFVVIDSDLKIIDLGPSMNKILGDLSGRRFEDVFEFVRPKLSILNTYESFLDHQNIVIILESKEYPLKTRFRGQFIFIENDQKMIYINSPWITNVLDLGFHNLLISDFAIHDTITDNLQLLHSKEIVNDDMKRIADELIVQRDELVEKNETIIELARFPDQNPQPVLRLDMEGRVMYANDSAVDLISNDKLMEQPFWGTIHLKFERNNYSNYEREFKLGDKIFHATMVPIRESNYFNVYLRDITQTILYQNELLSTSSRLYSLINSMHSAVLAESDDRKIILVNQIFCDLFEIPVEAEQMKGVDCSQAAEQSKHLFEDESGFVEGIDAILAKRERVYGDILRMKNGKILERDYVPIYEHGVYIGHIWKYQDITEQMNSKESLKKVEDKYSKIIENLELGLIEVDLEENITKVYPAFCNMSGYSEQELLGKKATDLLVFDEDRVLLKQQNESRRQGISGVYEAKIRSKNGSIKWLIISGTPIYDINNNVVGSLGVHVDISDRKKLEVELREANEKAMSSVKLKEMFVANISHEIRTPINVITGMLDLIGEEGLDNERKKYVQTIKRSANALLDLINDLLDYSKIGAGQMQLEETNVNLYDMFDHLDNSFSEKTKDKGIQLLASVDKNINPQLISDRSKLNQVLVNIISNAVKFTEKGHVKFECQLIKENEKEQRIKFCVSDTGVGIAKENLDSIFHTFTQEDSSVSRKYGGTGLGLSISREIVMKMGGEMHVDSEKGKGSVFSFELDLRKGKLLDDDIATHNVQLSEISHLRILVAEDNELNQTLIRSILDKSSIQFDIAENGEDVIDKK
jgi:PAS domain S-box-containing protein